MGAGNQRRARIGTRGSPLARWQANWVARRLRGLHPALDIEIVEVRTEGDRDRNTPLAESGGQGLFTKEIQSALLDGVVDLAVHSLKDLPTTTPEGLVLAAVPPREDLADALIAPVHRRLADLPSGARVGTGSPRRRSQLLNERPDLEIVPLRGNVETRLRQALDGALDAVVLAAAGLVRLGLEGNVTERLEPPRFLPAVGQGALGIECRADDVATLSLVSPVDEPATRLGVLSERALLKELEGGCTLPLGAWGRVVGEELRLDAVLVGLDGAPRIAGSQSGPRDQPEALGRTVAELLRDRGATEVLRG